MALLITKDCISCDACVPECPNEAIRKKAEVYEINSDHCTECVGHYREAQCMKVCPAKCIVKHPKMRETREELKSKFTRLQLMKK